MVTREIRWLSSTNPLNDAQINGIGERLAAFYKNDENYYHDIDPSSGNWVNPVEKGYERIVKLATTANHICEFGCGSANILKHFPSLQKKYSGCDFSDKLIHLNQSKYSEATFKVIEQANRLPFKDQSFDLVFSTFVIEHCNRPSLVLDECTRILKSGGRLVILCPNFLGRGIMSSQRGGFSSGTSSSKLRKGRYWDAIVTLFDNRVRIPFVAYLKRRQADRSPQFFINVSPTVFDDPFISDVDAIYLTYKKEMMTYLGHTFEVEENSEEISACEREKGTIFLSLIKRVGSGG